jgi:methylated-DNA-[protein]-cysteine S-methyltransferase
MTHFAKRVYKVVMGIPLGQVRTYKWVAKKSGSQRAYRAVGRVLKNNPCPLIIPCHRVVRSDNVPGGYIFGKDKKKQLLKLEKEISRCLMSRR